VDHHDRLELLLPIDVRKQLFDLRVQEAGKKYL
jgi:hypothetical protein